MGEPVFDVAGLEIGMPWRKGIIRGREEFCDLSATGGGYFRSKRHCERSEAIHR
jgi:hypothetical protein